MPRTPINFQNTSIYKIVTTADIVLYMGHTTEFTKSKCRMKELSYKIDKPKGKYSKLYSDISDAGGWDNIVMVEIEKYPCSDAREADAEVFRLCQLYSMELLNKQYEADEARISKGEHVEFKHKVKHQLKYRC